MSSIFDDLKKFAISDILSVSGKDKTTKVIEGHMNVLVEVALIKGEQSRQAEIDELKRELGILQGMHNAVSLTAGELVDERDELRKRIDSMKEIMSAGVYHIPTLIKDLNNALKGESNG